MYCGLSTLSVLDGRRIAFFKHGFNFLSGFWQGSLCILCCGPMFLSTCCQGFHWILGCSDTFLGRHLLLQVALQTLQPVTFSHVPLAGSVPGQISNAYTAASESVNAAVARFSDKGTVFCYPKRCFRTRFELRYQMVRVLGKWSTV